MKHFIPWDGSDGTSGGLEHMGDVWTLLLNWERILRTEDAALSAQVPDVDLARRVGSVAVAAADEWAKSSQLTERKNK